MSIRVTCAGCHTRFDVNERFAGKEGPCPKCKKTIKIPSKSDKVSVHAPQEFGPTTASGQAVFKPITRKYASLSAVQMVLIGAIVVGFLAIAFLIRVSVEDKAEFQSWVLLAAAVCLAFPCVYAAYTFLRDSELGAFQGQDLAIRISTCAVVYSLGWLLLPVVYRAVDGPLGLFIGTGLMVTVGIATVYLFLNMDVFVGALHYGFYFGCCLLLRITAGFDVLPTSDKPSNKMDDLLYGNGDEQVLIDSAVQWLQLFA